MADIQTQWALVFKTDELEAGMQHVKDLSNETTRSVGEGWTTAGDAAVDALKKLLSQSEETHGRTKEQVEKASQAVDLLGDAIGIKVPAALQKMAAESEVVGPVMEAAFPVLAAVALATVIVDIIGKIGEWISSLRELSDEEKNAIHAETNHYKKSVEFAHRIIELRRQALLVGKSETEQARLRAQFAAEDEKEDQGFLAEARREYAAAQALLKESEKGEMRKTDQYTYNARMGTRTYRYEPVISDDQIKKAKGKILELEDLYGQGLEDLQQETVLAGERRNLADAQANQANLNAHKQHLDALKGLYQKNRSQNQGEIVALDDIVHRHNKIVVAKKDENQAGQQELTTEQILASAREVTLKQTQQEAQFAEKSAANNSKIADLQKEIASSAVEHNQALAVALGYKTQEKADAESLAALEQDKKKVLGDANTALTAQIGIVKNLAQATMGGMLGSPEQKAAYQKAVLDYQKLKIEQLNLEKKYDDQISALQVKLANSFIAQFRKQLLSWRDINKELGQTFQTTLNSMNANLASFVATGQANWQQLATSAIESIVQILLQQAEAWAAAEIMDALGLGKKKAKNASEARSSTAAAAANTLADVPFPENIPASIAVQTLGEAYSDETYTSMGGAWMIDSDRLNFVHRKETILPPDKAVKLDNMLERGGSGGISVFVNHTVNAMDAESFQAHIRRHGNMIGNEVARVLKRKGFAPAR